MSEIEKATGASMPEIANSIRNDSALVADYTPFATKDNAKDFGEGLMKYDAARNEFIEALVTRIIKTVINTKRFVNPLSEFKKGQMPLGYTIQDVYTDLVQEKAFDPVRSESEVFKREIPDVKAYYYDLNRRAMYKQTISEDQLRSAFTSWDSLASLADSIINAMTNSNQVDEFEYTKKLMDVAISDGRMKIVKVPKPVDQDSANKFIIQVRAYSNNFAFPSRDYNPAGVKTWTSRDDQRIMLNAVADATVSVESLASAFHLDQRNFLSKEVLIDKLPNNPNVAGVLFDRNFYMIYDQIETMKNIYNPEGLYFNFFYHAWQIYGASMFTNAVVFMYDDDNVTVPDVTGVVISPASASMRVGETLAFAGHAQTTHDGVDTGVTWTLTGASSETTKVDTDGKVTVGADETAAELTLTAKSKADATKTRDATITIIK